MGLFRVILLWCILGVVLSNPLDGFSSYSAGQESHVAVRPRIWKRFINPSYTMGVFTDGGLPKMRTRRGEEADECQKLQLCKLHAESNKNFLAAYELYFVNKENARQWDHHQHRLAECNRLYGDCNSGHNHAAAPAPAPAVAERKQTADFVDDDYYE